jgi:hypothetical protein
MTTTTNRRAERGKFSSEKTDWGICAVQKDAKKDYKDRLFKFIFGNLENRKWTLSLYNAVNGTDYSNPDL